MKKCLSVWLWLALVGALLTGCAGRDFTRPDAEATRLGTTTYSQVVSTYGSPRQTSAIKSNGEDVKVIQYAFAQASPFSTNLRTKVAAFGFDKANLLVTYDFISSFDDTKSAPITKEQSEKIKQGVTRADVIATMGKPNGEAIFPITEPGKTLLRYNFLETWRIPFVAGLRQNKKIMLVTLDQNGIVSDVKTSEISQE